MKYFDLTIKQYIKWAMLLWFFGGYCLNGFLSTYSILSGVLFVLTIVSGWIIYKHIYPCV